MKKQFINEVNRMKNLFDYRRGVVISEQYSMGTSSLEAIPRASGVAPAAASPTYEWADCIIKTASPDEKIEKGVTNVVKNLKIGRAHV